MRDAQGFTLIELLVVIAIIGLLSSIVLASLNTARMKARDTERKAQLKEIENALELYYDAYGVYPPAKPSNSCGGYRPDWATSYCTDSNWLTTDNNFLKYLSTVPRDPLNALGNDDTPWWSANTYTYGVSADGKSYDLLTNLENQNDPERCALRLYQSVAVWPTDTGCWSSGTPGNVAARAAQIWSPK
ncbi:MAG: type II secretion system protein [Patescibacteria group bacterium]|nr:type II secretion system protein [Patescibacteria group bacterium]MDE2116905.1 type II secretion system protein [Patescibacteria group bacterium]